VANQPRTVCPSPQGDGINHPLSQQVKMDEIAKNMIPNANSAKKKYA
jgi:hypothetical protein